MLCGTHKTVGRTLQHYYSAQLDLGDLDAVPRQLHSLYVRARLVTAM